MLAERITAPVLAFAFFFTALISGLFAAGPAHAQRHDPYAVTRGGIDPAMQPLLKLTPPREAAQNESGGAVIPDADLRVLFYNTAMLTPFYGFTNHVGMFDRWDLIPPALLRHSNGEMGGYDVLVLSELFANELAGVNRFGFGPDPNAYLFGQHPGYGINYHKNNDTLRIQTLLWDLGWIYQTKAPGESSQFREDGGVIIASRWPIEEMDDIVFSDCDGNVITHAFGGGASDCSARKGVIYAKIVKQGRPYHVFGTHMQASAFESDGSPHSDWQDYVDTRRSQLTEMRDFIFDLNIPGDEPVIMGGDMNIDFGTGEYADMLSILNAEAMPTSTRTGRFFTSDKLTNDLTAAISGPEPDSWLDHAMFSTLHRRPASTHASILPIREPGGWVNGYNGSSFHYDLSDHHAVLADVTMDFSRDEGHPFLALAGDGRNQMQGRRWTSQPDALQRYVYMRLRSGDFNLDGRTDIAQIEVPPPGRTDMGRVRTAVATPGGTFETSTWADWPAATHFRYLTGDFDRDGKTDLLRVETPKSGRTTAKAYVGRSTASVGAVSGTFTDELWASRSAGAKDSFLTGDFNGDGHTDLLHLEVPSSGWGRSDVWVGENDLPLGGTSAFVSNGPWATDWHTSPTDMRLFVGDFDGDGASDLLKIDLPSHGCSRLGFWVGVSRQDPSTGRWSFSSEGDHAKGEWTRPINCKDSVYFTGDFDRDGRTDVGWVRFDDSDPEVHADRTVYVALARPSTIAPGKWFFYVVKNPHPLRANRHVKLVTGDFDFDQRSDLLALLVPDHGLGRSCMGMRILYGNASGLLDYPTSIQNTGQSLCNVPSNYFWSSYRQMKLLTGDFDVDGKTDLFFLEVPWP